MVSIDEINSFCKRKGLVFPSSEMYGGVAGIFDYGPVGVELKNNIKKEWWNSIVHSHDNVVGMDGSILTNSKVWEASGHVDNFVDLLVECKKCGAKLRADHLIEEILKKPTEGLSSKQLDEIISKNKIRCTECKKGELSSVSEFNLMFKTNIGPSGKEFAFLRPETAQLIFTQFKNIVEVSRMKLPFGIAQIGKAFRNEISPRNFLFRMREFEQMELEFFCHPKKKDECDLFDGVKDVSVNTLTAAEQENGAHKLSKKTISELYKSKLIKSKWHAYWIASRVKWYFDLGIRQENLRIREHVSKELSHYSASTWDIEYNYEFGWKELEGIADRTDFDLQQHAKVSKKDMAIHDEATGEKVVPHVVSEPSVGVDRAFLTFIIDAYNEEEVNGEKRIFLKLNPKLAPVKAAVFPLVNKEGMDKKAEEIYKELKKHFPTFYDDSGSIGRRYRRMDEIGTPFCITIDGQTMQDSTVTLRSRDTLEQQRVKVSELVTKINKTLCA
ncbi:MAG: glycine--tRNA ligase [Candidatus Nanoarchaeia archaeon]|nr:glycine--tRNA ligase [Candidatus Nanoarchaeia archaeon]MDD5239120.1 glycine--tRNA ligase [Candidatus Nanoarchaeia archaeon]